MPDRSPGSPTAVVIAYALVCVVWGSTYLFIKLGVAVLPPFLLGGVRFSIAGVILLGLCLALGRRMPGWDTFLRAAGVGVLLLVIGNGLLNTSEQHLSSGLAALLVVTFALWTTLFAMLGHGAERLSRTGWLGLLIGLAGVGILVRPFEDVESSWTGVVAVLAASFAWAVGTVYARRSLKSADPFAASAIETAVAGPLMLGVYLVLERDAPVTWNGQAWLAVLYLAGMGSLVGFTAYVYITAHMSSSKVGTYAYVNPVVAILLGWWFLDEAVTWRFLMGGATVLVGLLLVYLARVREARPSRKAPVEG